jgi:hypothetical protein
MEPTHISDALEPVLEALKAAVTGPPAPKPPRPGELAWYTDNVDVRAWRYRNPGPDGTSDTVELNYTDGSIDIVLYHPDKGWRFTEGHYLSPTE